MVTHTHTHIEDLAKHTKLAKFAFRCSKAALQQFLCGSVMQFSRDKHDLITTFDYFI